MGGSGNDRAYGIAVDGSGSAYVTGYTSSANFPTTLEKGGDIKVIKGVSWRINGSIVRKSPEMI